jgi:hypothetical protein
MHMYLCVTMSMCVCVGLGALAAAAAPPCDPHLDRSQVIHMYICMYIYKDRESKYIDV